MQVILYKEQPEILKKPSEPVTKFDRKLTDLVNDMFSVVVAKKGAGLAAVQLGIHKQIIVSLNPYHGLRRVFINPKILETGKETAIMEEGCLSAPGESAKIERPTYVKIEYQNLQGKKAELELKDFDARIFFHEYDHLLGICLTSQK